MSGLSERAQFSFESGVSASYLVIGTSAEEQVLNYQVEMVAENTIPGVLAFDVRQKDDSLHFYYNITSKLALSQFLSRRKLKRDEFIRLISSIIKVLWDTRVYFLFRNSFVIDVNYIYIEPFSLKPYLAYLPIHSDLDIHMHFKSFLTHVIFNAADIDESNTDNFLQRIITYMKTESFNVFELGKLLDELKEKEHIRREDSELFEMDLPKCKETKDQVELKNNKKVMAKESHLAPSGLGNDERKNQERKTKSFQANLNPVIFIPVCDAAAIILAVTQAELLKSLGNDLMTTYLAFGLILLALNALAIKKLKERKSKSTVSFQGKQQKNGIAQNKSEIKKDGWSLTRELENAYNDAYRRDDSKKVIPFTHRNMLKNENPIVTGRSMDSHNAMMTKFSIYHGETTFLKAPNEKMPYLQSKQEEVTEKIFISKTGFIIGRLKEQVDFCMQNKTIGKVHAEFVQRDGVFYLKDLNSRNGTFINNKRIDSNKEVLIKDKDTITFANNEYVFIKP